MKAEDHARGLLVRHDQLGLGKLGAIEESKDAAWVTFIFFAPDMLVELDALSIVNACNVQVSFEDMIQASGGFLQQYMKPDYPKTIKGDFCGKPIEVTFTDSEQEQIFNKLLGLNYYNMP
jgi:hypothetical protein